MQSLQSQNHLKELDWPEVLRHLQNFCTSGTAKIRMSALGPAPSAALAQTLIHHCFDAVEVLRGGSRPFMESLDLFESWFGRLKRNAVLKTLEIKDVRSFCLETLALEEVLKVSPTPWAENMVLRLMKAGEPLSAIDQLITPRGEIRSDASETLFRLFREKDNLTRQIESTLDKLVKDFDMQAYLQDRFVTTREGRWVLPVRSGRQHSVDGVIHGSSQTKQTVYMEPGAVVPLNNRLRQVEVEIEDEIERLLAQISEYLAGNVPQFLSTREALEDADIMFAKAQWTTQIDGKNLVFSDPLENKFNLLEVYHPLMQLGQKKPIPNTVELDQKKGVLLLSGPNAGGKTVLLKSVGLAAQMARCGLPICAQNGSKLPFFQNIHIGIGDSQSVDEELSTFAAHVKVLNEATSLKGSQNLILIDEICGSTDPEEGAALARSFIEEFAKQNCFAVITSHLGPLKSGWSPEQRVMNGSMEYDSKSGRPSYIFLPGVPGDSLAIQTAKRVGVAAGILDRATELLSPTTRMRLAGIEEMEQMRADIQLLRESLKTETKLAQAEQLKFKKLNEQLEREKESQLRQTVKAAEKNIDELLAKTKVEQTFKRHTILQEIKNELPEIVKSKVGTPTNEQSSQVKSVAEFTERFPPGTKIFVPHLQQDGLIQSLPNAKGEVLVLANSIRLNIHWQELKPALKVQNPTAHLIRRSSQASVPLVDQEKVLDLRGLSVDDAIMKLESELDFAATRNEERIKVIHGHGTEALKKAVRTHLSRSRYVKKWKAGSPEQGGDGITWAELGSE